MKKFCERRNRHKSNPLFVCADTNVSLWFAIFSISLTSNWRHCWWANTRFWWRHCNLSESSRNCFDWKYWDEFTFWWILNDNDVCVTLNWQSFANIHINFIQNINHSGLEYSAQYEALSSSISKLWRSFHVRKLYSIELIQIQFQISNQLTLFWANFLSRKFNSICKRVENVKSFKRLSL